MNNLKFWRDPFNIDIEKDLALPSSKEERSVIFHVGLKDVGSL